MASYWFTARPENVEHQHPFLVFDSQDRMHLPLTRFAKEARSRLDPKTVPTYLYTLCPYFTWLDMNVWQVRMGQNWDSPPTQVRRSIDDYLTQKLQCQILPQRQGWKYVKITTGAKSTLRIFLAALKLFYQLMREREMYSFANPLVDSTNVTITATMDHLEKAEDEHTAPPMPAQSGVEPPHSKPNHRLTDSYYKLEHDEWKPQIVDDPNLPGYILKGGQCLSLKQTRMRGEVVTWLLFETGARVSEVVGLMLSDWAALGTKNRAKAFSKGSSGRRIKTISFAEETVILPRRYFDEERIYFDSQGYSLDLYLELAARKQIDLSTVPLFLSSQGTQLTPKAYREHYWNPACQAAGIDADVHQARHWHVTRSVRDIYETAKSTKEIEQRLRDLVEYMKWKSEEMLATYQHYFDEQRHADTQGHFHTGSDPTGTWPKVHARVLGYVMRNVRGKPWIDHLALIATVMTAQRRDVGTVEGTLKMLHQRFSCLFPLFALDSMSQWASEPHFVSYVRGEVEARDTLATCMGFFRRYMSATKLVTSWWDFLPQAQQNVYSPFVLPALNPFLAEEFSPMEKAWVSQQQTHRKAETEAVVPEFTALRAEAHFRFNRLPSLLQNRRKACA